MKFKLLNILLLNLLGVHAVSGSVAANESGQTPRLDPIEVMAPPGERYLHIDINPRDPRQPIPAQDGAEILKGIGGFHVIRKGGTDGDPVFRGMAGSRLGILLDGAQILGGCGNRMDPPTAYVFPASYDRVTVLRGPQTVTAGPGMSAGVVRFERDGLRNQQSGATGDFTLTAGSFGRRDLLAQGGLRQGNWVARAGATLTRSGDYRAGDGRSIHASYERWSGNMELGWHPTSDLEVAVSGILSDGRAAYADRAMDGVSFERRSLGLNVKRDWSREGRILRSGEFHLYTNTVDHVMDNFSMRPFLAMGMMAHPMVSNPDRETTGGSFHLELEPREALQVQVGLDFQANEHRIRRTMNESMHSYRGLPRQSDARFENAGVFGELSHPIASFSRLVAGMRLDRWKGTDYRDAISLGMMGATPNPTADARREKWMPSGFLRLEHDFTDASGVMLGIGHVGRFPDYWELFNKEAADSVSAFGLAPERTTQVDFEWIHQLDRLKLNLALFAAWVDDFILIESEYPKGMRRVTVARNVSARSMGGEAEASWRFSDHWKADLSVSATRGSNRTDRLPLPQQPPLESRLGLAYSAGNWTIGGLARMVAAQRRVSVNQGNIVGQDLGPSGGFAIFSLNAAWRPSSRMQLSVGVDNLLDRSYSEHLSRGGVEVAGFPSPALRLPEPGRNGWVQARISF